MNSTKRQPTDKDQARGIWHRLTEPLGSKSSSDSAASHSSSDSVASHSSSDSVADVQGLQRRLHARLLASLLVTLLPLGFLIAAVSAYLDPMQSIWQDSDLLALAGTLVFWAVAYGLSRTGRYKMAARLLVGAGTLGVFAISLGDDNPWKATYLFVIVLLSSLFLSTGATVLLVIVHAAGLLLLPLFSNSVTFVDVIVGPLIFMLIGSAVALLTAHHRDRLERERQAELRESEERFRSISASAQDAIVMMDNQGAISYWNRAAERMFGYTAEEVIGKNLHQLCAPEGDLEAPSEILERFQGTGQGPVIGGTLEQTATRKSGEEFPISLSVSAVRIKGHWNAIGIIRDITERVRTETIRARAEKALERRTAQLEALREVGLEVNAQLDLDELLRYIVSQAIELLGGTRGSLDLYHPDRDVLEIAVTIGLDWPHSSVALQRGEGLVGKIWETGETLIVDDYGRWEGRLTGSQDRPYSASVVGVPVRWGPPGAGEEFLGVLTVESETPGAFSPADAELLSLFATQAAIAIRNTRLYQETQRRALEQETLREATLALTTTLDRDEVIGRILAQLQEVVPYDTASVQLLRRYWDGDRLEIVGGRGFSNLGDLLGVTFDPSREDNPNREVVRTRSSFIVKDAPAVYEEFRRAPHAAAAIRSWLGAPMLVGDQLVGMIALDKSEPGFYTQEHARLAEAFAAQAAVAIKNAQLFEMTQCQSRRLGQTLATSELLHQGLELGRVLEQIAQGATALGFRRAVINVREPAGELVTVGATAGLDDVEREKLEGATYRWPDFQSLLQEQFQVSRSYLIRQGSVDLGQELQGVIIRSGVADRGPGYWRPGDSLLVPLWSAPGTPVGLLAVDEPADGLVPNLDTIQTLETFANQAALAIQNARLFEAEREQRELAQALEKAAAAVSSTLELDQVLDRILEQVEQITGGDVSNIMLVEENDLARVARYRGYRHLGIEPAEHTIHISTYASLTQMMETREPLAIPDTAASSYWLNQEDERWLRSYAGAPICARDQVIGFLNVGSVTPDFFAPAHGRTIQAFANHAATAIENARLYQQLRNYAEQLERRVQERTAELQTQYARLDAILHSTTDGIVVTDAQGEILQTNLVAQAWLTHTLSPEEAGRLRGAVREVVTGMAKQPVELLELKGLDLELSGAPISESTDATVTPDEKAIWYQPGEPKREEPAAVVAIHDVSHLKALDRMKTRFVTNISHELRTPITTIKLYARLMQRLSPGDRRWKQYLDTLAHEANHQARLVEDILQISRIDAGRLEMQPCPTSLCALTEKVVASHLPAARERGLRLEHRQAESGVVTLVDPERMKQVLDNLISNATRYTPAGGEVTVSTEARKTEGRTWATVTVSDTGMGISEQELPHVFDRFFRSAEVRAKQLTGTGLGLAIVQEIVELHGGHVTVESEKGAGSTFTVWLPLISEETGPANP